MCTVFRYLILDDDIRVEFGKAHEHARSIAAEVLVEITTLLTSKTSMHFKKTELWTKISFTLSEFKSNPTISCELILTIAALTVRNEFCVVVEDAGGLDFIIDAMVSSAYFFESSISIQKIRSIHFLENLSRRSEIDSRKFQTTPCFRWKW